MEDSIALLSLLPRRRRSRRTSTSPTGPRALRPAEVGKRVAEAFIPAPHMEMHEPRPAGAALFARGHVDRRAAVRRAHEGRRSEDASRRPLRSVLRDRGSRVPRTDHVDGTVFGALPLELYLQDARFRYRLDGPHVRRRAVGPAAARRPSRPDALVDRRHVHDHGAAARGVSRHGRREISRARHARDGRVSREAAAAERPLLPCAGRAFLLGPRRRLGRGRHGGAAARSAGEAQGAQGCARRVPPHDGDAALAPGGERHVAAAHRPSRELGGNLEHGHVHVCVRHRRQERLARRRHLWSRGAQGVDRARGLSHARRAAARGVRGHGQTERPASTTSNRPRAVGDTHGQAPMLWSAAALLR